MFLSKTDFIKAREDAVFADESHIADYAKDAVYTLGGAYIINGDEDNMFHPQNSITRAEAAQLLYNALKKN